MGRLGSRGSGRWPHELPYSSVSTEGRNGFTKAFGCSHSSFLFYSKQEGLGSGHPMPRGSPEVCGPMFRPHRHPHRPPPHSRHPSPKPPSIADLLAAAASRCTRAVRTVWCLSWQRKNLEAESPPGASLPEFMPALPRLAGSVGKVSRLSRGSSTHPRTEARPDAEHTADDRVRHSVNIC